MTNDNISRIGLKGIQASNLGSRNEPKGYSRKLSMMKYSYHNSETTITN